VNDRLVRILTTSSAPEGEVAKALLAEEGIPVLLKGGAEGPYPTGPVHLFVPAGLEVQARLILAERGVEDDRLEDAGDSGAEPAEPGSSV
jgi:hypothetical protein